MKLDFLYTVLPKFDEKDFIDKIKIYKEILANFNRIHNLTHLKNIDQNILDSIEILKYFDFSKAKNIADIGSGAGFPAVFWRFYLKVIFIFLNLILKKLPF